MKRRKETPALIRCGDHQLAPWSVLCIHLINHPETTEWLPLNSSNPEVDFDYICPWCDKKREELGGYEKMLEFFRPVCIHCVRNLRKKAGLD